MRWKPSGQIFWPKADPDFESNLRKYHGASNLLEYITKRLEVLFVLYGAIRYERNVIISRAFRFLFERRVVMEV